MGINAYDKVGYSSLNLPTLQEMMQVPAYLTQKHEEAQEQIGLLEAEGNKIAHLAQIDPEVAKRYTTYQQQISSLSDLLMSKGVAKSNIRANVGKAKATYMQQVAPVLEADAVLKNDQALLKELAVKDPTLLVNANTQDFTHGAYLKRGNQSYIPNMVSGAALASSFGNKLARLSQEWVSKKATLHNSGLPYQYIQELRKGLTPDEVTKIMQSKGEFDKGAITEFDNYIQQSLMTTLDEFDVAGKLGNNPELLQRAITATLGGAIAAIGGTQLNNAQDSYSMSVAADDRRFERELALIEARERGKTPKGGEIFNSRTKPVSSESHTKIQKVGDLIEKDPELTNPKIITKLQELGISPTDEYGNPKSKATLRAEYEGLRALSIAGENEILINPNPQLEQSIVRSLQAAKLETRWIGTDDIDKFVENDKLKGQIAISSVTGRISMLVGGEEIEIPAYVFGNAVQNQIKSDRGAMATVLGLTADPDKPLPMGAIISAAHTRGMKYAKDTFAPELLKQLQQDPNFNSYGPRQQEALIEDARSTAVAYGLNAVNEELKQYMSPTGLASVFVASVGAQQTTY